jgi:hypothetical protein
MWKDPLRRARIEAMEQELRDYLRSRRADWVFALLHCEPSETEAIRAAFARRDTAYLGARVGGNMHFYGLLAEPAFRKEFELIRGYEYSPVYFMLLYRRRPATASP